MGKTASPKGKTPTATSKAKTTPARSAAAKRTRSPQPAPSLTPASPGRGGAKATKKEHPRLYSLVDVVSTIMAPDHTPAGTSAKKGKKPSAMKRQSGRKSAMVANEDDDEVPQVELEAKREAASGLSMHVSAAGKVATHAEKKVDREEYCFIQPSKKTGGGGAGFTAEFFHQHGASAHAQYEHFFFVATKPFAKDVLAAVEEHVESGDGLAEKDATHDEPEPAVDDPHLAEELENLLKKKGERTTPSKSATPPPAPVVVSGLPAPPAYEPSVSMAPWNTTVVVEGDDNGTQQVAQTTGTTVQSTTNTQPDLSKALEEGEREGISPLGVVKPPPFPPGDDRDQATAELFQEEEIDIINSKKQEEARRLAEEIALHPPCPEGLAFMSIPLPADDATVSVLVQRDEEHQLGILLRWTHANDDDDNNAAPKYHASIGRVDGSGQFDAVKWADLVMGVCTYNRHAKVTIL